MFGREGGARIIIFYRVSVPVARYSGMWLPRSRNMYVVNFIILPQVCIYTLHYSNFEEIFALIPGITLLVLALKLREALSI